jgi:hypothetical protein
MDDLIIIILTLLFTVVAAINQTKKKKIPDLPKPAESWKAPENIRQTVPTSQENPIGKKYDKTIPPRKVPTSSMQVETFEEEGSRNETVASILNKQSDKNEFIQEEKSIMEEFSLRKAIIFTEIIKPKYF